MDYVGIIVISAILVEAVVSVIKQIWDEQTHKISYSVILSLAIGVVIALGTGLDVASAVGVVITWPLMPQIISGILISRGSNYIYDLVKTLQTSISVKQVEAESKEATINAANEALNSLGHMFNTNKDEETSK